MHRLAKNPQGITGAQIEPTEVYNHLFPWLQGLVIFSIFRNYWSIPHAMWEFVGTERWIPYRHEISRRIIKYKNTMPRSESGYEREFVSELISFSSRFLLFTTIVALHMLEHIRSSLVNFAGREGSEASIDEEVQE
jgi:hypothetical protein